MLFEGKDHSLSQRDLTVERSVFALVSPTLLQLRLLSSTKHKHAIVSYRQMQYVKPMKLFQNLLKTKASERGRLLGLDVGDKYVGLAVSDNDNKIASPLSVLVRKKTNIEMMASDFQTLISELSLVGFIVGYPFDRQRLAPDATQVKLFIDDLSKTGKLDGVKYTFWDECFTSKNVELLLKPLNLHPTLAKTIVDKFAAVQILQAYLDHANKKEKLDKAR